jgi:hypothetical protein
MIRIGSRVKFLNDPGGGTVVRIVGNEAYVQDEDGFEIPTLLSNLIPDTGGDVYEGRVPDTEDDDSVEEELSVVESKPVNQSVEEELPPVQVAEYAEKFKVYLAFVLETDSAKSDERLVGVYLINEGDYFIYYALGLDVLQKRKNMGHGQLEPQLMAKIGVYSVQLLHEYSAMSVNILPYNVKSYAACPVLQLSIDWSELNLMAASSFQPNEYFDDPAIILDLKEFEENIRKKEVLLRKSPPVPKEHLAAPKPAKEVEEVDLHIDKIVSPEQLTQLSSAQILEIQIDRFTFALESALKARTKRIVFIHGVGNGKLRYEIQKILRRKYPQLDFQDASFAEYGYGATMVILRK